MFEPLASKPNIPGTAYRSSCAKASTEKLEEKDACIEELSAKLAALQQSSAVVQKVHAEEIAKLREELTALALQSAADKESAKALQSKFVSLKLDSFSKCALTKQFDPSAQTQ